MDDIGSISSKAQQGAALRKAVDDAYELVQKAHVAYETALDTAAVTSLSSDEAVAIREKGRAYAAAVMQYSNAVMAWLGFMNGVSEHTPKLVWKATSGK